MYSIHNQGQLVTAHLCFAPQRKKPTKEPSHLAVQCNEFSLASFFTMQPFPVGQAYVHGNLRVPQPPPRPRFRQEIRPYEGNMVANNPLIRLHFLGGVALGGGPLRFLWDLTSFILGSIKILNFLGKKKHGNSSRKINRMGRFLWRNHLFVGLSPFPVIVANEGLYGLPPW